MHFAIVEDLVMDQKHLIRLIQENLEKYHETADFDCFENGEDFLAHFRPGLYHAVLSPRNVITPWRVTVSTRLITC